MTNERILLADDDEMIVDALRYQLEKEGYAVVVAYDGVQALEQAHAQNPDLILLDVMMPKMQGWEVCREIRRESTVPILMLTARGEEMDRVLGLELGADDYVVKPFSFRELLARIHANLRRVSFQNVALPVETDSSVVQIGGIEIDKRRYTVARHGALVPLSQREYDLLVALQGADGAVVKRGDLLDQVWGEEWIGDPRTLDVHMRWLREKLEDVPGAPRLLLTVRGVGYRLVTADEL
ncbi:MAG: response regulator transcription factor [Caldilineaceae bacterium]|nr:response regulator transcription factor [Caldilineaceae bacterium]HRJ41008.1 response regulator transcription factor [Caldilineaceae bacterium]